MRELKLQRSRLEAAQHWESTSNNFRFDMLLSATERLVVAHHALEGVGLDILVMVEVTMHRNKT